MIAFLNRDGGDFAENRPRSLFGTRAPEACATRVQAVGPPPVVNGVFEPTADGVSVEVPRSRPRGW
jgi:hypothetical protein